MSAPAAPAATALTPRLLATLAFAGGMGVANVYFHQSLLAEIARDFGVSGAAGRLLPMFAQIGYGIGVLLVVPLGDMIEPRQLVRVLLWILSAALLLAGLSPDILTLQLMTVVICVVTVMPQILVPVAAGLAPPERRGRVLGLVQSGFIIGNLGARTFGGLLGESFGWRSVYFTAAGLMALLIFVLPRQLPLRGPGTRIAYPALFASMVGLFRAEPQLRLSCLMGACGFGAFSAFWTALPFLVEEPPYGAGPAMAGLIALVGAAGAFLSAFLGAPLIDRWGTRATNLLAIASLMAAYLMLGFGADRLWVLILGVNLLNMGQQLNQITNQARALALRPDARSRLNTVYMLITFAGGALGSLGGSWAWASAGMPGVCLFSGGLILIASAGLVATRPRTAG